MKYLIRNISIYINNNILSTFLLFFFPPQKEPKSASVIALYVWNI